MSMARLVIAAAIGFLVAQGVLYGLGWLIGRLRRGDLLARVRAVRAAPAPTTVLGAFVKYAAPVGIGAALITLAVWGVSDYLAARSARSAEANLFDSSTAASAPEQGTQGTPSAALTPPAPLEPEETASHSRDPYADPAFKVQRLARRLGSAGSLKEKLVQQSESRARNELLRELKQHVQRSQYDCEAAERAVRYLKAGLDVWGFATWQVKYFPVNGYRGATLERCRAIKNVVASSVDLQSAVAQQNPSDAEH